MSRYNPQEIEPKWQAVWAKTNLFAAPDEPTDKAYVLDMFPYPSGDGLHVGHPRGYTATDVYSHFQRYHGKQVLHPIGWDAFGLPAENAAIKKGVAPAENTAQNIDNFRRQLQSLGYSYDWQREVNTSEPSYYKWTQWIFTELFKCGLAYQADGEQWWCPKDKTVLANEQVIDGKCERCGSEVTKKALRQWYFKITAYADELLEALGDLDWPEQIKTMQRNWIGKSRGANIRFESEAGEIEVFTTRPDTIYGATYLVLAPEHPWVAKLTAKDQQKAVKAYIATTRSRSEIDRLATDKEKTGVALGTTATNPANGEPIPIWIADYVLASYGTGAIMAVPAHDQRDLDFARQYDLPAPMVVMPETGERREGEEERQSTVAVIENAAGEVLVLDWGERGGMLFPAGGREAGEEAEAAVRREVAEETGYTDLKLVRRGGMARNHYISIAKQIPRCATAELFHFKLTSEAKQDPQLEEHEQGMFEPKWVSAKEARTQITDPMHAFALSFLLDGVPHTGEGLMVQSGPYDDQPSTEARDQIVADLTSQAIAEEAVTYKLRDWLISRQRYWGTPIPIVHCEEHGPVAVPEDQLPVELPHIDDYLPSGDGRSPLAKVDDFVNTTCPECGEAAKRETDTMDTFADSSWYFLRYPTPHKTDAAFDSEALQRWLPVEKYVGGAEHAVLHLLYARFWTKALADAGHFAFREPFTSLRNVGLIHAEDGAKMSKSKGNVVNPDEVVEAFGADTLRVYELFIGPFSQKADWSTTSIEGMFRFLKRFWTLATVEGKAVDSQEVHESLAGAKRAVSRAVHKLTADIPEFRFNTAISTLMETLNELQRLQEIAPGIAGNAEWQDQLERTTILLSPFAPHLAEELWSQWGHKESIFTGRWPSYDPADLVDDIVELPVQVNGKLRATLKLPADQLDEATVVVAAKADPNVQAQLTGEPQKVIYIPGKLLNLVG